MDTQTLSRYLHDDVIAPLFRELLDYPSEATIEFICSERTVAFTVDTAPSDRGKVIGLKGRNAESLRILCGAVCARYGFKFHLNIVGANRKD